ncbi:MAG: hypothetical protein A2637_03085 [Candidatus Muproteobacteria bacterium RIFCSPHIGHO2_01_FULL_65_16]|uniref:Uncharacterized protein n=1 Tax=Candidatus Muproteobacteria bacterium RIFCSPHIGHO2_01_FULL_65_16 TaxID=1817764 RepID=A0A1F6TS64_9PROT|nr:MAG: hypothetical protein A2637_03085 [Candidatus Muproteobacteria bacterium RIFCSPHIGHO2_01_FULL_65_16]
MVMIWLVVIGLIANYLADFITRWFLDTAASTITLEPPTKVLAKKWRDLTAGNEGGVYLGYLERLLYFGAFWEKEPLIVTAWLAFKLASKWNVWTNVIAVPEIVKRTDPLDYLIARRRWGSHLLVTFLVGTLSNLILAYIGVIAMRYVVSLVN